MSDAEKNPLVRADTLQELCSWDDIEFIQCAYVTLLGRAPDSAGAAMYLARLRGGVSKLSIAGELRRSAEGRRHDPGIAGLDKALRKHRNATRPVIGALVRFFTGREGDTPGDRQRRMLATALAKLDEAAAAQQTFFNNLQSSFAEAERQRLALGDMAITTIKAVEDLKSTLEPALAEAERQRLALGDMAITNINKSDALAASIEQLIGSADQSYETLGRLRSLITRIAPRTFA